MINRQNPIASFVLYKNSSLFPISALYGDYFRLLLDGNYRVTAAVEIEDKAGNEMLVTRTKCVTVENDPKRHLEAVQLDFDFSDLSVPELEECGMVRASI